MMSERHPTCQWSVVDGQQLVARGKEQPRSIPASVSNNQFSPELSNTCCASFSQPYVLSERSQLQHAAFLFPPLSLHQPHDVPNQAGSGCHIRRGCSPPCMLLTGGKGRGHGGTEQGTLLCKGRVEPAGMRGKSKVSKWLAI